MVFLREDDPFLRLPFHPVLTLRGFSQHLDLQLSRCPAQRSSGIKSKCLKASFLLPRIFAASRRNPFEWCERRSKPAKTPVQVMLVMLGMLPALRKTTALVNYPGDRPKYLHIFGVDVMRSCIGEHVVCARRSGHATHSWEDAAR